MMESLEITEPLPFGSWWILTLRLAEDYRDPVAKSSVFFLDTPCASETLAHPPLSSHRHYCFMDEEASEWAQRCRCGKQFYQPNAYTAHINNCSTYKKDVGSSLQSAKARWEKSTKGKKGKDAISSWFSVDNLDVDNPIASSSTPGPVDAVCT